MSRREIAFNIAAAPPPRLDKALSRDAPEAAALSRSRLARLIAEGAVAVDGAVAQNPSARVAEGAEVRVTVEQADESHIAAEAIPLDVVHEDADLIVINKPAGMVVHPAPGSPGGTLVNALLHHCGTALSGVGGVRRPGIVHRIDKNTSGLLVVAKSDAAHHGLADQFAAHSTTRRYLALVHGVPDAGVPRLRGVRGAGFESGNVLRITTQLARHRTDRQKQAVLFEGGRHAITRARVLEGFGTPPSVALVECWLETGRTHQLRVHMAHVGHGLVGDPVYGGLRRFARGVFAPGTAEALRAFPRQALHAANLGFLHPVTGQQMRFKARMPADMHNLLRGLRQQLS